MTRKRNSVLYILTLNDQVLRAGEIKKYQRIIYNEGTVGEDNLPFPWKWVSPSRPLQKMILWRHGNCKTGLWHWLPRASQTRGSTGYFPLLKHKICVKSRGCPPPKPLGWLVTPGFEMLSNKLSPSVRHPTVQLFPADGYQGREGDTHFRELP